MGASLEDFSLTAFIGSTSLILTGLSLFCIRKVGSKIKAVR